MVHQGVPSDDQTERRVRVGRASPPDYEAAADAVSLGRQSLLWGLEFIPSALVHDGVRDCIEGEDEQQPE